MFSAIIEESTPPIMKAATDTEVAPDPVGQEVGVDELLTDHEVAAHASAAAEAPSAVAKATSWLTDQPLYGKIGTSTPARAVEALFNWQLLVLAVLIAGGAWWYFKKRK